MFEGRNLEYEEWDDLLDIKTGRDSKNVQNPTGKYPIYGSGGIMGYSDEYLCPEYTIIIGRKGTINSPILVREKFWNIDTAFGIVPKNEKINVYYLFEFCNQFNFESLNKQTTLPSLTRQDLLKISMPVPPKELQDEFASYVEEIDKLKFESIKCLIAYFLTSFNSI